MARNDYNQSYGEKRRKKHAKSANDGSENEVLFTDVKALSSRYPKSEISDGQGSVQKKAVSIYQDSKPERFSEIEVEISELSSTGDGLGLSKTQDHVYVVPFSVPGDFVLAKIDKYFPSYTTTDFIKVIKPGPQRNDSLARCPYFAKCAGCQMQMLPYDVQLAHKKSIVEKAYRNFSTLTPEVVPPVAETIGSPLQYGYRTKLTPHFDGPPGAMSRTVRKNPHLRKTLSEVPAIGFQERGTPRTLDIEDCPIGTNAVRQGMQSERKRVARDFANYTKGATILLRESTVRKPKSDTADEHATSGTVEDTESKGSDKPKASVFVQNGDSKLRLGSSAVQEVSTRNYIEIKSCITDQRAISTEYVGIFQFKNTAGAFFQNNNSILPTFTAYIRDRIIPKSNPEIKYLIDAYCGSGLFTITLSSLFKSSMGIDIAGASVTAARENALFNKIDNANFITADASMLFKEVEFPADETAVVIDPPRKGCDGPFLQQLLRFGPRRVVYVRCLLLLFLLSVKCGCLQG